MEKITRHCLLCGNEFDDRTKAHKKKFCTVLCGARYRTPPRQRLSKLCQTCGIEFVTRSKSANKEKFCSAKCRQRVYNVRFNRRLRPLRQLTCEVCQKVFTTGRKSQICCTQACNSLRQSKIKTERRHKIWERDNHRCRICDKEGKKFAVHHWDGTGETDHRNDSPDNLVSVCITCHKAVHTINYIILDGELCVYGKIFELLGAKSVRVLERSQIRV